MRFLSSLGGYCGRQQYDGGKTQRGARINAKGSFDFLMRFCSKGP